VPDGVKNFPYRDFGVLRHQSLGSRDAMVAMRSERVIVRILLAGHAFIATIEISDRYRETRISSVDPQLPDDDFMLYGGFLIPKPVGRVLRLTDPASA
jgi:hypothetical protein